MELADSGAFGATFLSILQLQREVTKKRETNQTTHFTKQRARGKAEIS